MVKMIIYLSLKFNLLKLEKNNCFSNIYSQKIYKFKCKIGNHREYFQKKRIIEYNNMKIFKLPMSGYVFQIQRIDRHICTKLSANGRALLDVTFASILCITEVNDVLGSTMP